MKGRSRWSIPALCLAFGVSACLPAIAQEGKKSEPAKKEARPEGGDPKAKEKAMLPKGDKGEIAVVETNLGVIKIKLYPDAAPKAVENFLGLATQGKYDGVIFHRVIDGFMIQGGDPTGTGSGGVSIWGRQFEDEFSPKYRFNRKGLLAMANAGPRTNGSQFFITLGPTPHLNDKHTIFGEVILGMEVVEKIAKVKKGPRDRPLDDVVMKKVSVEVPKPGEKAAEPKPAEKAK